jgi:two-component system phosphate regulon sensor histidine kinase PhoR
VLKKQVRTVIIAGCLAIAGILALQVFWVQNNLRIQEQEQRRQKDQQAMVEDEFNERVRTALSHVARQISRIYNNPEETYKTVEQLHSNYFVVRINDTLHPYLLENLLKRAFDEYNINEDFQYGIYDCFTDSVVYSDYVSLDSSASIIEDKDIPEIEWQNDGHYFSVRFPSRKSLLIQPPIEMPNAWLIASAAVFLAFLFFGYAINTIIRQKRISEMRNDFISNMTHELKTPISTIGLSAEMLLRNNSEVSREKISRYASIISAENKRLERQVERVLQISRLEKGKVVLQLEMIDIKVMIEECVNNFSLSLIESGGKITVQIDETFGKLKADKLHFTTIINNLIDNAIKYSDRVPEILITAVRSPLEAQITVRDSGIGMDSSQLKQIFEKFYRAQTGNIHNSSGYGLGLYYVKLLTDAHGWGIMVDSNLGEGSEFKIKIPLHDK